MADFDTAREIRALTVFVMGWSKTNPARVQSSEAQYASILEAASWSTTTTAGAVRDRTRRRLRDGQVRPAERATVSHRRRMRVQRVRDR
jgi:hypothetical protein